MASSVTVRVTPGDAEPAVARAAVDAALAVLHEVDRTCTRFDPGSDLMLANAAGERWQPVAPTCFDALVAAHAAYRRTHGRFDPRVLDDLVRLGYDHSMRLGPPGGRDASALRARAALPPWEPQFRRDGHQVRVGSHPVDLGGIAKGLAVRWAAQRLDGVGRGHLVEAGGDCRCTGTAPGGGPWHVAVEDPNGGADPVAVLEVHDRSVATSSVRLRHWEVAGNPVHHLLDPDTGLPGGAGLASVTVVDDDPADAEVWSKVLFLTGHRGIATTAAHFGVAALWVTPDGALGVSAPLTAQLLWVA
jgi:thiamine biosynthesis lipoprotein